jgi:Thymidylate synthase complementing protein
MTTITAKIIADSVGEHAPRLTTMELRYPRCIHPEVMTHRVFSRNASSSRAIPVERLIQDVLDDPFIPLHWGKNQRGMQADEECNETVQPQNNDDKRHAMPREHAWLAAMHNAVRSAKEFSKAGYHKQVVNRLLEPFAHINVVVTSTEWSNFFALRDHPDAEPHICILAQRMKEALSNSEPKLLEHGDWHLPYVTGEDLFQIDQSDPPIPDQPQDYLAVRLSVARCARVSYKTHDGRTPNVDEDLKLAEHLLGSVPLHASPAEHQAQYIGFHQDPYDARRGNLAPGWIQYRKTLEGECQ